MLIDAGNWHGRNDSGFAGHHEFMDGKEFKLTRFDLEQYNNVSFVIKGVRDGFYKFI